MKKTKPGIPVAPVGLTRKHLARVERERRLQRWLFICVGAVLVIVAGLIGYAFFDQQVLQPRQPVAIVGGVSISVGDFQKQVRYSRVRLTDQYWNLRQYESFLGNNPQFQAQLQQVQSQLGSSFSLGRNVLDGMIEDELIRQEAAKRGIKVAPDEIDGLIRESFNYFPNGTPTPEPSSTPRPTPTASTVPTQAASGAGQPGGQSGTPTGPTETPTLAFTPTALPTETPTAGPSPTATEIPTITPTPTPYTAPLFQRDFRDFVTRLNRLARMNEADARRLFESNLYRRKLTAVLEATPLAEGVHARQILVADEATAKDIIKKLQAGGDFVALAAQYSTDKSNKDTGGDLGFFGRNQMVPEFEKAAFDNPVGLVPQPVKTQFGWHVIEVLEKQDESMDKARQRALTEWLQKQRDDPNVVKTFEYWDQRIPSDPTFDPVQPPTAFPTSAP
ncbi:MAG: peptidylprolyl isomerase [Chloroflexi bacterium]|nr:peptidylprolyl isomerase [Chloroflexota bacterium]